MPKRAYSGPEPSLVEESAHAASALIAADASHVTSHLEYVLDERAGPLDTEQRRVLEAAWRSSRRLAKLAGDLRDVVRAETGELDAEEDECDLATLVERAVQDVWPVAAVAKKRIDVDFDGDSRLPGDRELLARAVGALVDHAVAEAAPGTAIGIRAGDARLEISYRGGRPPLHSLGLTLAGAFAALHGGGLTVSDEKSGVVLALALGAPVAAVAA
jgi:signal transduction histidine kinase